MYSAIAALRGLRTRLLAKKESAVALVEFAERKRERHQAEVDELARQIDDVDESLFEHGAAPEATPFESGRRTA